MPESNTYFISDLHLGARYLASPIECERRVVSWLDSIKHDAAQIFLLGDILDYWYEYKCVVPRGFVRFLGKLAELADSGIKITWMTGNHDIWIFDYLPSELGIRVVDGPISEVINGKTFFMDHGDNVGNQKTGYRIMRSIFRNRLCQWLYASIHPRWTIPFATGWSKQNRLKVRNNKAKADITQGIKILEDFSESYSASHPEVDFFIFGHVHSLLQKELSSHKQMFILGEWIHTCSYAIFNGVNVSLHTFPHNP